MSTLYWINVLGNLNDLCMIIFFISIFLSIVFFIVTIFYENEIKADLSKAGCKRFVKVRKTICVAFILSTLAIVFLPTKSQLYMIYGVGGTIERKTRSWELNKGWRDETQWEKTEQLIFRDTFVYRIKPEPKYRPFRDAEECLKEMSKHTPFGWIKFQGAWLLIVNIDDKSIGYGSACGATIHS